MQKAWISRYDLEVPANVNYPGWTVPDLLRQSADRFANSPALLFYGACISYGELDDLTTRFALGLRQLGISQDDQIGSTMGEQLARLGVKR